MNVPIFEWLLKRTYSFEPQLINDFAGIFLIQLKQPSTTFAVLLILPHGLDALLEDTVVAANGKTAGQLNVVVHPGIGR